MAVNWYPGHMLRARKKIKEVMPHIDLVIEVMDARIPYSSENPIVTELRGQRPSIKILNKDDLADPQVTKLWLDHFEQAQDVKAIALSMQQKGKVRQIPAMCRKFIGAKKGSVKTLRVMIMGIPNVGKSTLINILAGKTLAKVGDEPAVTRQQQRISLEDNIELYDSPGMLWPRMKNEDIGYRLAVSGAIKNTALEFEDVALYAGDYFLKNYPQALLDRYKLKSLPSLNAELMEIIARKRGGLRAGGVIDLHKASEILLHEYRTGKLGRLSLETPAMIKEAERLKLIKDALIKEKEQKEQTQKEQTQKEQTQKEQETKEDK